MVTFLSLVQHTNEIGEIAEAMPRPLQSNSESTVANEVPKIPKSRNLKVKGFFSQLEPLSSKKIHSSHTRN